MRRKGGFMGGEMIFMLALMALAVFGVFKYMKAETNSYNEMVESLREVEHQANANGDVLKEQADELRKMLNRVSNLEHRVQQATENIAENESEIEKAQDHSAIISKELARPRFVTLVTDKTKPVPIEVVKAPVVRNKRVTRKKTTRTKSGIVSISESNEAPTRS